METFCGGVVGGLVGTSLALQGAAFHPGTIIGGACFGAVLGYLVGRSRIRRLENQRSVDRGPVRSRFT